MNRSWKDVKADKERIDRAGGRDVKSARARAAERTNAHVIGFRLAELRASAELSQTELARRMGVSQARISQLEHGDVSHLTLDAVRRYVAAVGGRLRVVADFDDHDEVISTSRVDRDVVAV